LRNTFQEEISSIRFRRVKEAFKNALLLLLGSRYSQRSSIALEGNSASRFETENILLETSTVSKLEDY